jgi:uncharacterized membrane protein YccC
VVGGVAKEADEHPCSQVYAHLHESPDCSRRIRLRDGLERDRVESMVRSVVVHSARTAVAAVASLLVARLFRLPEAYWAPITTLMITQSSLGAALTVSRRRLVGTALGAVVAAMVASLFGPSLFVFGASVFMLGLLCAIARSDRSAYRFAGLHFPPPTDEGRTSS